MTIAIKKTPADEVLGLDVSINSTSSELEKQNQGEGEDVEATISGAKRYLLLLGLLLSIFLASLDVTIVSTTLARIVSEFNGNTSVTTWVATAYLLTSTAMQPLYGKLSDIFGRKYVLLFALIFFIIGSAGCGAATSSIMLIIFRAVAGIGGGGLYSLSIIIISDIVPPKSRGMYLALAGGIFALASVAGPLIGGSFTDSVSWRWAFYINLPICAITLVVVMLFLNLNNQQSTLTLKEKVLNIDFLGIITLMGFSVCLLLGLTWGGEGNNWGSPSAIATIVIAFVSIVLFGVVEAKYARDPIISSKLLNRNVIMALINMFFNGALLLVLIFYLPIYFQVVQGTSATIAGLELLPLLLGCVVGNFITGFVTLKTGKYVFILIIGSALQVIGIGLLSGLFGANISKAEEIIYTLISGLGIGISFQNNVVVAQSAVPQENVAPVTSMVYFCNQLGSVVALAIQGSVYSSILITGLNELKATTLPDLDIETALSVERLVHINSDHLELIRGVYIGAFHTLFLSVIPYVLISFIVSLFVKHIQLRS